MEAFDTLAELGLMVTAASLALLAARPLRLPPILAFLAAGIALGPLTGFLSLSEPIELIAEVGVALLLFLVGLELSLARLRELGGTAVAAGVAQVAVTFGAGFGAAVLLGFQGGAPVILGLATAFSSTVVVVKLLDRVGGLEALHGRLAIGILLVQDVLVAVALTLVGAAGDGAGEGGAPLAALALALAALTGVGAAGALVARWVLPRFVDWLEASPEALFLFALSWAFGFILLAESLHLSVELGAFLAGVLLAQLRQSHELWRRTQPLVDFFLAVFFVSLGAHMDAGAMGGLWGAAAVMVVLVLVLKPVVTAVVLALLGQPRRDALLAGLTLGQVSEFAFVLTGLAVASGMVEPGLAGFVGVVGMATIGVSALAVPRGEAVVGRLERRNLLRFLPGGRDTGPRPGREPRSGHVVVVGMNTLGRRLVEGFAERGLPVTAVDTDAGKLRGLPGETVEGDLLHPAVVAEAGLAGARLVVSALQIEEVNSLLAHRCREMGVPVSVHAFDPSLADELLEIGADHLLIPKQEGVGLMEARLRELGVLH